jgi:hypothetical protein
MGSPPRKGIHRMMLSLDTPTYEAIRAFAEAAEKPMSTVVRDAMIEMQPILLAMTKALEAQKAGRPQAGVRALGRALGDAFAGVLKGK